MSFNASVADGAGAGVSGATSLIWFYVECLISFCYFSKVKIVYTEHARYQMAERNITELQIRNTLLLPMQVIKSASGRLIAQKVYKHDGGDMLLRVFFEKINTTYLIVTAYWTSKINKYLSRRVT